MKLNRILLALAGTTFITACSPSVPKCSDDLVVDTLERIYKKRLGGSSQESPMSFKVDTIRTLNTNSTTGAHECAATLNIIISNEPKATQSMPLPFKYRVELLDNKNEVYVSIIP